MPIIYEPNYYNYVEWIDCPVCGYPHREDYNCQTGKRDDRLYSDDIPNPFYFEEDDNADDSNPFGDDVHEDE